MICAPRPMHRWTLVLLIALAAASTTPAQDAVMLPGRILDEDGEPVADITVRQLISDDDLFDLGVETPEWEHGGFLDVLPAARSDDDGRFELALVESVSEYASDDESVILLVSGPGVCNRMIELEDFEDLELTMWPEARIRASVHDEDGRPLAGVHACIEIEWFDEEDEGADDEILGYTFCSETGSDGRLELSGLRAGSVFVLLSRPLGEGLVLEDVAIEAPVVELGGLELPNGSSLTGRVVDAQGADIPGALITLLESDGLVADPMMAVPTDTDARWMEIVTTRTDAEGGFVVGGLHEGAYRVVASAGGHRSNYLPHVEADGDPARLVLRDAESMVVRVRDRRTGLPLADAEVAATRHPDRSDEFERLLVVAPVADDTAETAGDRRVLDIGVGAVLLEVGAPGYGRRRLRAPDDLTAAFVVDLAPGSTVHGRVVDEAGQPVWEAGVVLRHAQDPSPRTWRARELFTGPDGLFRFEALDEGHWTVHVDGQPTATLTVAPSEVRELELVQASRIDEAPTRSTHVASKGGASRLPEDELLDLLRGSAPVAVVRGRLLIDGEPVQGTVRSWNAFGTDSGQTWSTTDAEGHYLVYEETAPGRAVQMLIAAESTDRRGEHVVLVMAEPDTLLQRDIELRPGPNGISGLLRDRATGQPLVGMSVVLRGSARSVTTDASGRFEIAPLIPGPVQLTVRRGDFIGHWKAPVARVTPAVERDVALDVPEASDLAGRIAFPTGWPKGRLLVVRAIALDDQSAWGSRGLYTTVADGEHFLFDALPHGAYRLELPVWSRARNHFVEMPVEIASQSHTVTLSGDTILDAPLAPHVID